MSDGFIVTDLTNATLGNASGSPLPTTPYRALPPLPVSVYHRMIANNFKISVMCMLPGAE